MAPTTWPDWLNRQGPLGLPSGREVLVGAREETWVTVELDGGVRVTIDDEQRWFAQCGFEALAIRWLVPGQHVRIDAPCLCCGEPVTVEMADENIITVAPAETVGYTSSEVGGEASSRPFR